MSYGEEWMLDDEVTYRDLPRRPYCGGCTGILTALVVGALVVGVLAGALVLGLT